MLYTIHTIQKRIVDLTFIKNEFTFSINLELKMDKEIYYNYFIGFDIWLDADDIVCKMRTNVDRDGKYYGLYLEDIKSFKSIKGLTQNIYEKVTYIGNCIEKHESLNEKPKDNEEHYEY